MADLLGLVGLATMASLGAAAPTEARVGGCLPRAMTVELDSDMPVSTYRAASWLCLPDRPEAVMETDGHSAATPVADADLVVLDVFMPGLDGVEAFRQIHQLSGMPPDRPTLLTAGRRPETNGYSSAAPGSRSGRRAPRQPERAKE